MAIVTGYYGAPATDDYPLGIDERVLTGGATPGAYDGADLYRNDAYIGQLSLIAAYEQLTQIPLPRTADEIQLDAVDPSGVLRSIEPTPWETELLRPKPYEPTYNPGWANAAWYWIQDTAAGVSEFAGNVGDAAKGAASTLKVLGPLIPLALIGVAGAFVYSKVKGK